MVNTRSLSNLENNSDSSSAEIPGMAQLLQKLEEMSHKLDSVCTFKDLATLELSRLNTAMVHMSHGSISGQNGAIGGQASNTGPTSQGLESGPQVNIQQHEMVNAQGPYEP